MHIIKLQYIQHSGELYNTGTHRQCSTVLHICYICSSSLNIKRLKVLNHQTYQFRIRYIIYTSADQRSIIRFATQQRPLIIDQKGVDILYKYSALHAESSRGVICYAIGRLLYMLPRDITCASNWQQGEQNNYFYLVITRILHIVLVLHVPFATTTLCCWPL